MLVKCTKISELSPRWDLGPSFILISLALEYLKGTEQVETHWNGWIGVDSPDLGRGTNFEITEEAISWLLPHKICIHVILKCYLHFKLLCMSYTLTSYWQKPSYMAEFKIKG